MSGVGTTASLEAGLAPSECEFTATPTPGPGVLPGQGPWGLVCVGAPLPAALVCLCSLHWQGPGEGGEEAPALLSLGGGPEAAPPPGQSGVRCSVAEAEWASSGNIVGGDSPVRLFPLSSKAGGCSWGAQKPQEEALQAGARMGYQVFTSGQTVPCPSQGRFSSLWDPAWSHPPGLPLTWARCGSHCARGELTCQARPGLQRPVRCS